MQSCTHLKFLVQNKFNQRRKLPAEKLGAKQNSSITRYQLNIYYSYYFLALPFYAPIHFHPLPSTPTHSYPLPSTPTHFHPLPSTPIHFHPLPSTPTHSHPLPPTPTCESSFIMYSRPL